MKWPTGALNSIAILDRQSIHPSEVEAATPYLGLEHLDGDGGIDRIQTVGSASLKSNKFQFSDRHVLFGKLRPYLRKIVRPEFSGVCSTDIIPILPKEGVSRDYLFYFLRTPDTVNLATSRCSGANLPRLGPKQLASFQIPLPPLAEQKRIAEILDAADALRAKRREAIAQLDTLLQSMFIDLFGDPVTNPMGWDVVAFESIGNSRLGKMLDKGKEVGDCQFPYLANTNVQWGRFDLAALRTMDFSESDCEEFKLENGDLLICEGGEVGRTAIWHGAHDRIYFQKALHRVRLDPTVAVPEYVFQFMWFMAKNGGFRDLTTSATIAHLTGVKLKRLPCPRPPLEFQHRFAAIVQSVEQQKASQHAHLAELDTLFASLQSRAFRGDL